MASLDEKTDVDDDFHSAASSPPSSPESHKKSKKKSTLSLASTSSKKSVESASSKKSGAHPHQVNFFHYLVLFICLSLPLSEACDSVFLPVRKEKRTCFHLLAVINNICAHALPWNHAHRQSRAYNDIHLSTPHDECWGIINHTDLMTVFVVVSSSSSGGS